MWPHKIVRLDTTTSTMIEAEKYPPGVVVAAEEQTAGQGRLGRTWHSEKGAGLYFSQVLEPLPDPLDLPIATLAIGVAVHESVETVGTVRCDLRWPNDLLIGGKKCAGILVQLQNQKLIAGVGVNVNHARFPEELASIATSLRLETGKTFDRDVLLHDILDRIDEQMGVLAAGGRETILRLFSQTSSYVFGRRVSVDELTGVTDGLDDRGFLWLRTGDGRRRLIRSGNVRPE